MPELSVLFPTDPFGQQLPTHVDLDVLDEDHAQQCDQLRCEDVVRVQEVVFCVICLLLLKIKMKISMMK